MGTCGLSRVHIIPAIAHKRCISGSAALLQPRRRLPSNAELIRAVEKISSAPNQDGTEIQLSQDAPSHDTLTANSDDLPQSPLTDPKLNAARFGHKQPKPAKGKLSHFQLGVQKNPFAQALASPLRQCLLTGAHLPKDFLLHYGLAPHPETGDQWHMPSLAIEVSNREAQQSKRHKDEASTSTAQTEHQAAHPVEERSVTPRTLSGTHFLSSYKALRFISKMSAGKYRNMLPFRWKENGAVMTKDVVWREDMADFMLEMMRKEIVSCIESLLHKKGTMYIASCESFEKAGKERSVSAIVVFKGTVADMMASQGTARFLKEGEGGSTPSFAMAEHRGKEVPVYCLETLLGAGLVRSLQERYSEASGHGLAVIRKKNLTLQLQMKLWKLVGYLN